MQAHADTMPQLRRLMAELQTEMASVMAAAVHQGWIPIEEMLDLLDSAALPTAYIEQGPATASRLADEEREWAQWTAQAFLDPSTAGKPCAPECQHSLSQGTATTDNSRQQHDAIDGS